MFWASEFWAEGFWAIGFWEGMDEGAWTPIVPTSTGWNNVAPPSSVWTP